MQYIFAILLNECCTMMSIIMHTRNKAHINKHIKYIEVMIITIYISTLYIFYFLIIHSRFSIKFRLEAAASKLEDSCIYIYL